MQLKHPHNLRHQHQSRGNTQNILNVLQVNTEAQSARNSLYALQQRPSRKREYALGMMCLLALPSLAEGVVIGANEDDLTPLAKTAIYVFVGLAVMSSVVWVGVMGMLIADGLGVVFTPDDIEPRSNDRQSEGSSHTDEPSISSPTVDHGIKRKEPSHNSRNKQQARENHVRTIAPQLGEEQLRRRPGR